MFFFKALAEPVISISRWSPTCSQLDASWNLHATAVDPVASVQRPSEPLCVALGNQAIPAVTRVPLQAGWRAGPL